MERTGRQPPSVCHCRRAGPPSTKTFDVTLHVKAKPLATEDWIGEDPRPAWSLANEWLPEYTAPVKLDWQAKDGGFTSTVKLRPGEMRVFFIKTK